MTQVERVAQAGAEPREGVLLATVALGAVLAPLNSTMIAVALPGIAYEFAADPATASWLVTTYLLAMASLQPLAGRLGDRLGRRRLILGGLTGFGLASLGATAAPSLLVLIACRLGQAVSGAVVLPNGDALLREVVPDARRAGRFGALGAAIGLAAAAGPPLGGLLVGTAGWRAMFAVNLLLVLPALVLGLRVLPSGSAAGQAEAGAGAGGPNGPSSEGPGRRAPFDWPGALLLPTILAGAAAVLSRGTGGSAVTGLVAAGLLVGLAVVFVRRELRHPAPIVQPRFFGRRAFALATGAVCLSNLAMYSVLLAIPLLWAQLGRPSVEIGGVLGVMAGAMVVGAPVGGRLADRLGRRWPTACGLAGMTLGAVQIALTGGTGTSALLAGLLLLGLGLGLATPGLQVSALEAVERQHAGAAAGAYSTSRYLGSIVGSALLAGLASAAPGASGAASTVDVSPIFGLVVAAAFLSTLLALGLPHRAARSSRPA